MATGALMIVASFEKESNMCKIVHFTENNNQHHSKGWAIYHERKEVTSRTESKILLPKIWTIVCTLCSIRVVRVDEQVFAPNVHQHNLWRFFLTLIIQIQSLQYYNHDVHTLVQWHCPKKFSWSRIMCYRCVRQINFNICERRFYDRITRETICVFASRVIHLENVYPCS